MGNPNKLVSVILVNYNNMKYVGGLVESLRQQTYSPIEVLVFDNGSADGSLEYLSEHYPEAQIFKLGNNMGFCMPNNLGIQKSKGDYLLILNFDVVLEKDFIEEMVNALESEEKIGWVAGKILKLTPEGKGTRIDALGHHMTRERCARAIDPTTPFSWDDYNHERFVFGSSACAALYSRKMLEDVSLNGEYFDEDHFIYFEDVDLDWRAQQRGWKCRYTPSAVGYHARYGTGVIRRPYFAALFISNRIFMIIKNDAFTHCREDLMPILRKTWTEMRPYLFTRPWVIVIVLGRLVKLLPKMYRKRKQIQSRRTVSLEYIRSIIR